MTRNGFTLLELLVALAVFSIAALALLRLDAVAVRTTADLQQRDGSLLVAQNEAALIASAGAAPISGSQVRSVSNGGRTFEVRQLTTPTPDRRLLRIDLQVTPVPAGGGSASLTLIKRVR